MQSTLTNRLLRLPGFLRGKLDVATLRLAGAHIGKGCWLREVEVPCDPWDIWLDDGVQLEQRFRCSECG